MGRAVVMLHEWCLLLGSQGVNYCWVWTDCYKLTGGVGASGMNQSAEEARTYTNNSCDPIFGIAVVKYPNVTITYCTGFAPGRPSSTSSPVLMTGYLCGIIIGSVFCSAVVISVFVVCYTTQDYENIKDISIRCCRRGQALPPPPLPTDPLNTPLTSSV